MARSLLPANDPPEYMGRMELMREVERLRHDNHGLRAEIERLREARSQIIDARAITRDATHAAETEIERLRETLDEALADGSHDRAESRRLQAEVERLREAQRRHEWGLGQIAAMDVPASRIAKAALRGDD